MPAWTSMPAAPARTTVPGGGGSGWSGSGSVITSARRIRNGSSPTKVKAAGQGSNARTRRSRSRASPDQSRRASALRMRGARVAADSSWGRGAIRPVARPAIASPSASAPMPASRSVRVPAVSSGRIGHARARRMSPVSIPSSIRMIVAPVSESPASSACCTGAAPRHRGSSDAWTLMHPEGGMARTSGGRMSPYAAVTTISGWCAARRSRAAGARRLSGCSTGSPSSRAAALTGLAAIRRPRPAGRSARVYTAAIRCGPPASILSEGTANSGVPAKTTTTGGSAVRRGLRAAA